MLAPLDKSLTESRCSVCRVVAVDMRGYGESGKPSGVSSYWLPTLSADIKELIERLGQCCQESTREVGSHFWGGHKTTRERVQLCNSFFYKFL